MNDFSLPCLYVCVCVSSCSICTVCMYVHVYVCVCVPRRLSRAYDMGISGELSPNVQKTLFAETVWHFEALRARLGRSAA